MYTRPYFQVRRSAASASDRVQQTGRRGRRPLQNAAQNTGAILGGERLPCVRGAGTRSVTEGLLPHQRFSPMADRCSRSPNYVSAPQVSSAPKTALLTDSSGTDEAPVFAPDRSFSDLSRIQLRKSILQSRFARQLPLHKGAFVLAPTASRTGRPLQDAPHTKPPPKGEPTPTVSLRSTAPPEGEPFPEFSFPFIEI